MCKNNAKVAGIAHSMLKTIKNNKNLNFEITYIPARYLGMLTFSFFFEKRSFRYENDDEKSKTKRSFF